MESSLRWMSILKSIRIVIVLAFGLLMFMIVRPDAGWVAETNPSASGGEVVIAIVPNSAGLCDKAYDPPVVTVKVGITVVWVNQDLFTHTLASGEGGDPCQSRALPPESWAIDGGQLFPGMTYRKTFDTPGVYIYTCHLPMHRMQGKVIVVP